MKYQNLQAFEKHLQEAFPAHLSHVYMVISPDSTERRRLVEKITSLLLQQGGESRAFSCEAEEGISRALELMRTQPLFQTSWIVHLADVDLLKKEEVIPLAAYVARPSAFAFLIMSAEKAPFSTEFYEQTKKELIFLDMSSEKPWDKKGRLKQWLIAEAAKEKKVLSEEAALFLLERVGTERAALEQELFKLLTYAYEKKNLSIVEARTISSGREQMNLWKLAEKLVWEEEPILRQPPEDTGGLLAFIAQTRTHLEAGLRANVAPKYEALAKRRGPAFFSRALLILFEIELKAKSVSLPVDLLWDFLISKITMLKVRR